MADGNTEAVDWAGKNRAGWERIFLCFTVTLLPWRAQPPQGPKATSTQPMDISCSTAPPRARSQQETRQHAEPSRLPHQPLELQSFLEAELGPRSQLPRETEAEALGGAERSQLQGRWS